MKNNWDKWLLEVEDDLMCRYNITPQKLPENFGRIAWIAWSSGKDSMDFSEDFARERHPEM